MRNSFNSTAPHGTFPPSETEIAPPNMAEALIMCELFQWWYVQIRRRDSIPIHSVATPVPVAAMYSPSFQVVTQEGDSRFGSHR